jgi:acyl transferase domain-containing protein
MQQAADQGERGSMMAVRARGDAPVEEIAAASGVAVANFNAPDQLVLSGSLAGLEEAERRLAEVGVRGKRLPVAGAFHSPLMEPAVAPFQELVEATEVREPRSVVLSCVTAQPFDDIGGRLVQALTRPVRWTDVLRALHDRGATRYVETGPGRVLTTLVRKTIEGSEAEAPLSMEAAGA